MRWRRATGNGSCARARRIGAGARDPDAGEPPRPSVGAAMIEARIVKRYPAARESAPFTLDLEIKPRMASPCCSARAVPARHLRSTASPDLLTRTRPHSHRRCDRVRRANTCPRAAARAAMRLRVSELRAVSAHDSSQQPHVRGGVTRRASSVTAWSTKFSNASD